MTETDSRHSYLSSAEKAARETDFYRVEAEDLDSQTTPPLIFETILSHVEGSGAASIELLLTDGLAAMGQHDRLVLAQFLAFQVARGRARRREILESANKMMLLLWQHATDDDLAERIRANGSEPTPERISEMRHVIENWKAGNSWWGHRKPLRWFWPRLQPRESRWRWSSAIGGSITRWHHLSPGTSP